MFLCNLEFSWSLDLTSKRCVAVFTINIWDTWIRRKAGPRLVSSSEYAVSEVQSPMERCYERPFWPRIRVTSTRYWKSFSYQEMWIHPRMSVSHRLLSRWERMSFYMSTKYPRTYRPISSPPTAVVAESCLVKAQFVWSKLQKLKKSCYAEHEFPRNLIFLLNL